MSGNPLKSMSVDPLFAEYPKLNKEEETALPKIFCKQLKQIIDPEKSYLIPLLKDQTNRCLYTGESERFKMFGKTIIRREYGVKERRTTNWR